MNNPSSNEVNLFVASMYLLNCLQFHIKYRKTGGDHEDRTHGGSGENKMGVLVN